VKKKSNNDTWDIEWFVDKGARITDPYITIIDNGTLLFSSGFVHKAGLEDKMYLRLSYHKPKNAIVFDFTADERVDGAYKIVIRGEKAKSGSVTCRSFFKKSNLDPKNLSYRYAPEEKKIARAGVFWFIDLNKKLEK
jgi:hypothetical protein